MRRTICLPPILTLLALLTHGVPPDRLWALWTRFAEQLPDATAEAEEWRRRCVAKNLYRLDEAGLHPVPAPS